MSDDTARPDESEEPDGEPSDLPEAQRADDVIEADDEPVTVASPAPPVRRRLRLGGIAGLILVLLALYYPIGMIWVHRVDDDTCFRAPPADALPGASEAVGIAIALIAPKPTRTAGRRTIRSSCPPRRSTTCPTSNRASSRRCRALPSN